MGLGLAALNRLAGLPAIDRLGIRRPAEQAVYHGTKAGFRTAAAVGRSFTRRRGSGSPRRPEASPASGVFDLNPTADQQMMVDVVREFATDVVRPAAADADAATEAPPEVLRQTNDLGVTLVSLPEALGGLGTERSATTGVLVGEAFAHGDMGLAASCLAPASVATAISLWGTTTQQQTYLPAFAGDNTPTAALTLAEPRALFDPFDLHTRAVRVPGGYRLTGTKSAVVRGAQSELFVVAADCEDGGPALFVVESNSPGITIESEPAMGLRSASLTRLILDDVRVGEDALLGGGGTDAYTECVRLSRLAWCSLSLGTAKAVLDYVTPYVKERKAFGEPVAHRQSVAFMVADIAIELEGMRLATYRAAARADQGLPHAREVALARRLCSEYGMRIGTDGVQLLGGHGFVKEHPVERWYRDLRAIGVMEGGLLV
ncbi:MAG: acyl-CoA dehydrogenase family protein [Nocardioidaceae bacterium]